MACTHEIKWVNHYFSSVDSIRCIYLGIRNFSCLMTCFYSVKFYLPSRGMTIWLHCCMQYLLVLILHIHHEPRFMIYTFSDTNKNVTFSQIWGLSQPWRTLFGYFICSFIEIMQNPGSLRKRRPRTFSKVIIHKCKLHKL